MGIYRITEIKKIDIEQECIDNPIYLCWLNNKGGYSYWCFSRKQSYLLDTAVDGSYKKFNEDIESATGIDELISKAARESIVCGGKIPNNKMDGIKGLLSSPKVMWLTNPESWSDDGCLWRRVIVSPGSFITLDTNQKRQLIQITLLLPEQYQITE